MAFVATAGSVRALSRQNITTPRRILLSDTYAVDYAEIWRTNESVRTVVDFLARNVAQLGLHFYERNGDSDRQRLADHPLALLLRKPNPYTSRFRFIQALVCDFAIYSNAYWLKTNFGGIDGRGLVRIPPQAITPDGDDWLTPESFKVTGTRGSTVYPANQIVYFRGYGLDKDQGVSPLEALRRTLREEWAGSEMREQIMRNGARASGYLERPSTAPQWSDAARERFRQSWTAQYTGSGPGAGGTPILEDGMQFRPVSQTARDLQYIEARKLTREEVAAAYHVPPPMIGLLENATFSNITEQRKMLYTETLGPWLTMITEELELQLIPEFEPRPERFYLEFNIREKLTGDFVERGAVMAQAIGAPYLTVNEGRAMDNRPPIDGGDQLIRPLNVTANGDQNPIPADTPDNDADDEGTSA